jgi:hypothetical protein
MLMVSAVCTIMSIISLLLIPFTCELLDLNRNLFDSENVNVVMLCVFGSILLSLYGRAIYNSLEEGLPHRLFVVATLIGLAEVLVLPSLMHSLANARIGWFILLPWTLTLLTPYIIYLLKPPPPPITDDEVLDIAKRYGGVVTKSVVIWEISKKMSEKRSISPKKAEKLLEKAEEALERFCRKGEAVKKKVKVDSRDIYIYDFPNVRFQLAKTDNRIIEVLQDNPHGMSRTQLLQATALSIESLDEALRRLESKGIIYYDIESDVYRLMGIAPT